MLVLSLVMARAAVAAPILESVDFALDPFRKGHFAELDATLDRFAREDVHLEDGSRATDVVFARLTRMLSVDETLVPQLEHWRKVSKHRPWAELAQAAREVALAWHARGGGYANSVRPNEWPLFYSHLEAAEAALSRALAITPEAREPRAARVRLALLRQLGEAELVARFKEAVRVDPVSPEAHDAMFLALLPQWLGDEGMRMLFTFARDASRQHPDDPYLALLIIRAHEQLVGSDRKKEMKYYRAPEVWAEVSAAMGRFLAAYPDSVYGHNLLARLALLGHQGEVLRREVAWIGDAGDLGVWRDAGEFQRAQGLARLDSWVQQVAPAPAAAAP